VTPIGLIALAAMLSAAQPQRQRPPRPGAPLMMVLALRDEAVAAASGGGAACLDALPADLIGCLRTAYASRQSLKAPMGPCQGALRLQRLQLNMSQCACDDGLDAVAAACCDTLEQLVVRSAGPALGDEGVSALSMCSRLSSLDISGSSVTGAGARTVDVAGCSLLGRAPV
jgi:hypothetical protein